MGSRRSGFTLVEVLVTVTLVAGAIATIITAYRHQAHAADRLRRHAEARLILEDAAARYQFHHVVKDTTIVGDHGEYHLAIESGMPPEASALGGIDLEIAALTVRWQERNQPRRLALDVWREPLSDQQRDGF